MIRFMKSSFCWLCSGKKEIAYPSKWIGAETSDEIWTETETSKVSMQPMSRNTVTRSTKRMNYYHHLGWWGTLPSYKWWRDRNDIPTKLGRQEGGLFRTLPRYRICRWLRSFIIRMMTTFYEDNPSTGNRDRLYPRGPLEWDFLLIDSKGLRVPLTLSLEGQWRDDGRFPISWTH